ncbi:unnamed protein product, partial [Polarella glacialis]
LCLNLGCVTSRDSMARLSASLGVSLELSLGARVAGGRSSAALGRSAASLLSLARGISVESRSSAAVAAPAGGPFTFRRQFRTFAPGQCFAAPGLQQLSSCRSASSSSKSAPSPRGFAEQLTSSAGSSAPAPTRGQVLAADRDFLFASAGAGRQVVLHDYRDTVFLKRLSAAGVACTLMSSSGVAYALSFGMGPEACSFVALQTLGAGLALYAYLRTYVARAVLDPRRSQLLVTGCGLFGVPLSHEEQVPLSKLKPGFDQSDHFIKFRIDGSPWDPSCWVWFRMPRAPPEGLDAKAPGGAQVGYRNVLKDVPSASETGPSAPVFRFPGLSSSPSSSEGFEEDSGRSGPRAPAAKVVAKPLPSAAPSGPRKTIEGLKLQNGLPANAQEEQKVLDFLEDPSAYSAA